MGPRYKIQVFTHSGCMIELDQMFVSYEEACDEASIIAMQGLRASLHAECMSFFPALQISSVNIEDTLAKFVPNATITDLTEQLKAVSIQPPPAQIENQSDSTNPQSN